jgi:hypothetical protein
MYNPITGVYSPDYLLLSTSTQAEDSSIEHSGDKCNQECRGMVTDIHLVLFAIVVCIVVRRWIKQLSGGRIS